MDIAFSLSILENYKFGFLNIIYDFKMSFILYYEVDVILLLIKVSESTWSLDRDRVETPDDGDEIFVLIHGIADQSGWLMF